MLNTLPCKASIAPCPPPQSPEEGMELSEMLTQCISNFSALPFQDFCPGQMGSHIVSTVPVHTPSFHPQGIPTCPPRPRSAISCSGGLFALSFSLGHEHFILALQTLAFCLLWYFESASWFLLSCRQGRDCVWLAGCYPMPGLQQPPMECLVRESLEAGQSGAGCSPTLTAGSPTQTYQATGVVLLGCH